MNDVLILIPGIIQTDAELASWLKQNKKKYFDAMNLDASQFDMRATVDAVTILGIEVDDQEVAINYEFDYSVYNGCKDMDYAGTAEERVVVGRRIGNSISFKRFFPVERRTTLDEL
jgi:hypothetical protein